MKKIVANVLLVVMMLSLCSCGKTEGQTQTQKDDKKEVTMVLDWTPNTNHTGIYVAQELGYFDEVGLAVSVVQPPENGATDLVASGGAQFGIDFQDTLAAAFASDSPLPITAVAAILQHNTSGLISLKEKGIDAPAKMENHTYATWDSPIEQAILKNVVEQDGGTYENVKLISTSVTDIIAALKADIESVWIYYGWDGVKCEMEGIETNYLSFADMNPVFDYYSPVIIGNNGYLEKNPETAKAFLAAVKKGYEYAAKNPEEAAKILLKHAPELDEALVMKSQAYLSGQYIADGASWGVIDSARWNGFYNWLGENKLVENPIRENTTFTNSYLEP